MPKGETGNFVEVRSNARAFVGRKADGRLIAWGVGPEGATIPPGILNLTDFTAVYGAGSAFAAQRADGSLVAWGSAANGGSLGDGRRARGRRSPRPSSHHRTSYSRLRPPHYLPLPPPALADC